MTKENWVGEPNAWLDRTAYWADEKNMAESMRCVRKIGEGILAEQNEKKEIKTRKDFWTVENLIQMIFDLIFFKIFTSEILFYLSRHVE
jgi:hypothetical protein